MELSRWTWVVGFAGAVAIALGSAVYWLIGDWHGWPIGLWVFGTMLSVAYGAIERQSLRDAASTPAFAYSGTSVVMQCVVALIAVVAFVLADRADTTFDLTTDAQHTLSDHAQAVASSLDEPVHVLAFFRGGSPQEREFARRIALFEEASKGKLTVEWIDPLANPLKANQHGVAGEGGTIVLTQGDRTQRMETDLDREDAFTKKLVVVQSPQDHRICWSLGHGEADPDDQFSESGLGALVLKLEGFNYQVTKTLVATEGIDRGCEVLVVARPQTEWLPFEKEALAAYVAEGGAVFILVDITQVMTSPTTSELRFDVPNFTADLQRFGIAVGDNLVLDVDPSSTLMGVEDASVVVVHGDGIVYHPITQPLSAAITLPLSRSVSPIDGMEGMVVQRLLQSSVEAWAESDPNGPLEPNEGFEEIGQITVAAVSEIADPTVLKVQRPQPVPEGPIPGAVDDVGRAVPADFAPIAGGRVVVIGDSDFASNALMAHGNNTDLFLNTIAWMVAEEDQLGERPGVAQTLDISGFGAGVLCLVSLAGVPGLAIFFAGFTLLRRRFL